MLDQFCEGHEVNSWRPGTISKVALKANEGRCTMPKAMKVMKKAKKAATPAPKAMQAMKKTVGDQERSAKLR